MWTPPRPDPVRLPTERERLAAEVVAARIVGSVEEFDALSPAALASLHELSALANRFLASIRQVEAELQDAIANAHRHQNSSLNVGLIAYASGHPVIGTAFTLTSLAQGERVAARQAESRREMFSMLATRWSGSLGSLKQTERERLRRLFAHRYPEHFAVLDAVQTLC